MNQGIIVSDIAKWGNTRQAKTRCKPALPKLTERVWSEVTSPWWCGSLASWWMRSWVLSCWSTRAASLCHLCLQPWEMVPVRSRDPPGTLWLRSASKGHLNWESPDSWFLPWTSLWGLALCIEPGPISVGHRQAERLMVIYCLFLCPVRIFSIRNPAPWENRNDSELCYVLLILFSFESSNSFQFTYS